MINPWNKILSVMTNALLQAAICWLSIMAMMMFVTTDGWIRFFSGCLAVLGLIQSVRIHLLEKELAEVEISRSSVKRKTAKGKR